jgi:deoxyribodipyrimidine photo-lyase
MPPIDDPRFGALTPTVQQGGRREGKRVLQSFLERRSRDYMSHLSKPGVSARSCSRLSAHIAYGTLSVREIEQATERRVILLKDFAAEMDPSTQATERQAAIAWARQLAAFRSRLAWRCHFVQKLEQQPELEQRCMHPVFEGMREADFRQDFFDAWCAGQTGYPLVDACMRSLHTNGWITFRMRAMLVSFASYHLWLDWRRTAPYMAQLFTDYEPGIHYSQFQMQSGVTGINAVRIYNPIKQSQDQDPAGRFIRRYVPEIAHLPDELLHEPWLAGDTRGDYPPPIVEHREAIREARAKMSLYWRAEGFREQAQEVFRKLGSRRRSSSGTPARRGKKRVSSTADELQLTLDMGE